MFLMYSHIASGCFKNPSPTDIPIIHGSTSASTTMSPITGGPGHSCDSSHTLQCGTPDVCYSIIQKCDFVYDCPTATDEEGCRKSY